MKQYTMSLDGEWKLCLRKGEQLSGEVTRWEELGAEEAVAGQVPGDWVLDYVRQGLLEEPYEQGQYVALRQYESSHVFYGRRFCCDREPNERFSLLFEGIDTVADVYLNGVKIGHAENMFIPHEFPASSLRRGENELLVHIYPCVLEARKYPISAFAYSHKYNYESLVIRKAAHMFGWDICPRIVSAGGPLRWWKKSRFIFRTCICGLTGCWKTVLSSVPLPLTWSWGWTRFFLIPFAWRADAETARFRRKPPCGIPTDGSASRWKIPACGGPEGTARPISTR